MRETKILWWLSVVLVAAAFVSPASADKPPKGPGRPDAPGHSENAPGTPAGQPGNPGGSSEPRKPDNPGNSGGSSKPGKPDNPGNSGTSSKPGKPDKPAVRQAPAKKHPAPGSTPAVKAKAYGRWCQNQSKSYVAGRPGTQFGLCLTAMAKLATGVTNSPWTACRLLSRKHVSGQTGSPFSRCVIAGTRFLYELHTR